MTDSSVLRLEGVAFTHPGGTGVSGLELEIAPGETQMWRLANIGADIWYRVYFDGRPFHVIAEDANPVGEVYGNWSGWMKFLNRMSAGSMPSSYAAVCTSRSMRYDASVMRNEQRYATPPGALFVYAPRHITCAAG